MNNKKITDYLIKKLNKIRKLNKKELMEIDKFNFISSGHVDSFELLKFNLEIEEKFKISIKPKDTMKKNYGTIKGLTSIIENLVNKLIRFTKTNNFNLIYLNKISKLKLSPYNNYNKVSLKKFFRNSTNMQSIAIVF